MKIPIRNVYYLLAYAWRHADAATEREAEAAPVDTLPDLLTWILAQRVAMLLKRGLERSYMEDAVAMAGVRGKLEIAATLKQNLLAQARTVCTVEELEHDILPNQILRATLRNLLALPALAPAVRAEVGLVYRKLGDVRPLEIRSSSFRRVRIHRNNRPYRFLMQLCELLHESLHVGEDGSARLVDLRQRRHAMAALFEAFVAGFYGAEQSLYDVSSQAPLGWHRAASVPDQNLGRLPAMVPDLVLTAPRRRIVLDTKFYRRALGENRFGERRVRSDHLYQMFAYLENRNAEEPDGPPHDGILLYPVVDDALVLDFSLKGHRIQIRTIDLGQEWWQIRDDLLRLVDCERPALAGHDEAGRSSDTS